MSQLDGTSFSTISGGTSDSLTHVMVLHPIACGLAFIAFLLSLGSGIIGSLAGALVAFLAWILTLIVLATDFTVFGIIRHHVNHGRLGSRARFGSAIWLLVASFVTLFFWMLIILFTCASKRKEKKRARAVEKAERYPAAEASAAPRRKERFGIF